MRRLAAIMLVLVAGGLLGAVLLGSSAQGSSTSRFDVIFDDARGLVAGQLVKVAGARAGLIQNVSVTPDFKARIEATVDSQFMPFRKDATCTIRPEGLIAENYIDCDPGTPNSPPLRASDGHPPTVPVENTSEPVSLLDLFNIFNLPTQERFQVIINELGIGTAGRGTDFNSILLRANPTLALAREVIGILSRQRQELATIVDATNTIAQQGATHTGDVQRFLDRAASLTTLTANHRDSLAQTVARLPPLLTAAQPALQQLDVVARDGTPLVQQIHAAVPSLNQVSNDLGPFVNAAKPALASMSVALEKAIPAIKETTPLVEALRNYTHRSLPGSQLFARLTSNLQQHGFVENFLSITYYIAASLSRFDQVSHLLPLLLVGADNGACGVFATKPIAACSAHYGSQPAFTPVPTAVAAQAARRGLLGASATRSTPRASSCPAAHRPCARGVSRRQQPPTSATPSSPASTSTTTTTTSSTSTSSLPTQPLQNLFNYLFH
jgi:phospholipid/cholesterol/gamma-HCH transport system substrate-binding protein